MNDLAFATISQLKEKLEKKEITPSELLAYYLDRFKKYDDELGSALEIFSKESIEEEYESIPDGILSGIPGLIKDNICQKDRITSCASKILENFVATYDATAIAELKKAGAYLVGRANMDEFAMGSSTETSAFKKTKNPWNLERVPGGSSGGSAAAVAAGLIPWALGSETGGSVRQPAALCGIVGFKPTYGLVSRYGLVAYGSSLDQIGIFSRTVKDSAYVLSAIAAHDVHDSTSLRIEKKDYTKNLHGKIKEGLKIGIIENALHAKGIHPEIVDAVEKAIQELEEAGAIIKRITMPSLDYSAAVYFILSRAEAASNLARYDGVRYGLRAKDVDTLSQMYTQTRHDGFGQEVKARILVGNYVLSAGHAQEFYKNAQRARRMIRKGFDDVFADVDLLVSPVNPLPAFKFGAFDEDKLQLDLQDYFTCAMNIAGIPAVSIPCGFTKSQMPIGFQLIGPALSEELLLQTAHVYEQRTNWHTMHPPGF